jgi:hypothetical protein
MFEKIQANRFILVPLLLGTVAGAVVSIATGFVATYHVVTWLGN